jgi:hyperosmotically inducible protein
LRLLHLRQLLEEVQLMRSFLKIAAVTAAAIFAISGCSVMRGDQTTGDYVDDAALTARVKAALLDDEQVKGTMFNVDVNQGKVTLSGTAQNATEAKRAEQIARQTPGVKGVESTIRVSQASGDSTPR